jgi:hypothetical protein
MGSHKMKMLLHNKGNKYQNEEIAYRMGEIFTSYLHDTGLIFRIYKELKRIKLIKNKSN